MARPKKPAAHTVKVKDPQPPEFSMALWESLWRVVDASRLAICPIGELDRDSALEFLADQEKMLRRCIGHPENEDQLRVDVVPHPYVLKVHEQESQRIRALREETEGSNDT